MPIDLEKFNQGMSTQEYIDQIKVNKQPFEAIYAAVEVPAETLSLFEAQPEPLRLAVLTADWCGDAVSTTPAIMRLAESNKNISVQVFNRDEEVDLTNTFVPEHRANTVPVFVVFDKDMHEVARFIETAKGLVPQIDAMDDTAQAAARQDFESRWNRWNSIRTVLAGLVSVLLIILLLRL